MAEHVLGEGGATVWVDDGLIKIDDQISVADLRTLASLLTMRSLSTTTIADTFDRRGRACTGLGARRHQNHIPASIAFIESYRKLKEIQL